MSHSEIDIHFKKAVRAARRKLVLLAIKPTSGNVFAFVPGVDLTTIGINYWTSSKAKYEHLRKRIAVTLRFGRPLPPNLAAVAADMHDGKRPRFKKQVRTDLITVVGLAVAEASKYVYVYRNDATHLHRSACDAVVRAADHLRVDFGGVIFTYGSVSHRYRQYVANRKQIRSAVPQCGRNS